MKISNFNSHLFCWDLYWITAVIYVEALNRIENNKASGDKQSKITSGIVTKTGVRSFAFISFWVVVEGRAGERLAMGDRRRREVETRAGD